MDVRLPPLGEGADSGTVVNTLVAVGEQIAKEQPIIELETDKAVGTIPAPAAGRVTAIRVKTGDKISVGHPILTLEGVGEGSAASTPSVPTQLPAALPASPAPSATAPAVAAEDYRYESKSGLPPPASPTIRRLARDLGIDLSRVRGSERGGRIVLADLRAYIQQLQAIAAAAAAGRAPAAAAPAARPAESPDFAKWGPVSRQPMSSLRQLIAERLTRSWTSIPHVTQFDEADITALLDLKKRYEAAYQVRGARLTVTALVLKAVVRTLQKHPIFNASLDETRQEIVFKKYYHLGIAVDTDAGLIVPVLRDADKKSLLEVARELESLAERTRQRKISAEELKGGSFTISNQGGIGSGPFTPLINKPEVAILGLGRGRHKPLVREGRIEPRATLPLALSYDHRLIDGAQAARFMVDLVQAVENFNEAEVRI